MMIFAIYIIIAISLFSAAFITKRRYGVLALALAVGLILNQTLFHEAQLVVGALGAANKITPTLLSIIVIMAPSIVLLIRGIKAKSFISRFFGSLFFAVLALAILSDYLILILVPDAMSANVLAILNSFKNFIVGVGMILGVVDMFLSKSVKKEEKKK